MASKWRASHGCRLRIADALFLLASLLCAQAARAGAPAPPQGARVLGEWMTEDRQGVVRIEPCGEAFCGRVVGISDFPPGGLRDIHGAPQCGLIILRDLMPGEEDRRRGTITNPDDGRSYGAIVWVAADGDLRLRGFVGLPMLGSTQRWPRFTGKVSKDCHFVHG